MPDIKPLLRQMDEKGLDPTKQIEAIKQLYPDFDLNESEYGSLREKLKYPLPKQTTISKPKPKSINIIEAIRPFIATGANIAGNVAGTALTKSPTAGKAAGLGTAAAIDYGLQSLEGKDREESFLSDLSGATPNSAQSKLASTAQMGLENVFGGKIIDKLATGAKGVYQEFTKGGIADPLLKEMGATYSMYGNRPIAEFIENVSNVFHGKKTEALTEINKRASSMVDTVASRITGRMPVDVDGKQKLADLVNKQVIQVFEKSKAESTLAGTRAQEIADLFPTQIISGQKTVTSQVPITTGVSAGGTISGQVVTPQTSTVPTFDTISGPVYLNETLKDAYRLIKESPKSVKSPEEMKRIIHSANQLLLQSNAKFDNAGNLLSSTPVGFKDAWQFSKDLDELAFQGVKEGAVDPNARLFKHLASKVRDDVETSIPGWSNPLNPQSQVLANEALASWKNAKAIVSERNKIFDRATSVPKLLRNQTSIVPELDKIIADPKQLEKVMRLGSLNLPTTAGPIVVANNVRKDLAGYEFQKIMKDAWVNADPANATIGHFDKSKMIAAFTSHDKKESYKTLFSGPTRDNIEKFMTAVSSAAQSGKSPYTSSVIARAGYSGLTIIGTGFIYQHLDDPRAMIAGAILGGTFTLNAVGRAMSNPDVARLMTAMVSGAPLGMSEKAASKFVLNALQGSKMTLTLNDNTEREAIINADGKIKLLD